MKTTPFIKHVSNETEQYKGKLIRATSHLHEHLCDRILSICPPPARIIDFGCGQGALSHRLKDQGYDVLAVDMSVEDFQCDGLVPFEALNFNDSAAVSHFLSKHEASFDLALGIEVIEHVESPWAYMSDLKKLVKSGGFVMVSTPNITSWISRFEFLFSGEFKCFHDSDVISSGHIAPISKWELNVIFKKMGFQNVSFSPGGILPIFWISKNPKVLWYSCLNFLLYPFMKGQKNGYCLICTAQKQV